MDFTNNHILEHNNLDIKFTLATQIVMYRIGEHRVDSANMVSSQKKSC